MVISIPTIGCFSGEPRCCDSSVHGMSLSRAATCRIPNSSHESRVSFECSTSSGFSSSTCAPMFLTRSTTERDPTAGGVARGVPLVEHNHLPRILHPEVVAASVMSLVHSGGLKFISHGIFCRCSLPLLKSRNSGVVLAVCTCHYYCGSRTGSTMNQVAKAMVRILRNRREIQFVVLNSIRWVVQSCRPCVTVSSKTGSIPRIA